MDGVSRRVRIGAYRGAGSVRLGYVDSRKHYSEERITSDVLRAAERSTLVLVTLGELAFAAESGAERDSE